MNEPDRWLTQSQVARLMGVSTRTINAWRRSGLRSFKSARHQRGRVYIRYADLQGFLKDAATAREPTS